MRRIDVTLTLLSISLLAACTTTGYKPLPLTPLDQPRANHGTNSRFVEDAVQVRGFSLFPHAVSSRIGTALASQTEKSQALRNVQALICDGRKPRVQAKFNIILVPPKPQSGLPLDQANAAKTKFLKLAKGYIQNRFLDDASDTELVGKKINDEFQDYQKCMVSAEADRKCGRFTAEVTTVKSNRKDQLVESYRKLAWTPMFRSFGNAETIFHWRSQFMAVVFPGDHLAVLTAKAATIHHAEYTEDGSTFLTSQAVTPDHDQIVFARSPNFARHVHFIPAKSGYRINGEAEYPLVKAVMSDLAILKAGFTFIFSKDVVPKLVDLDVNGEVPHVDYQYFGYDPDTDNFSSAYATKNADHMWTQYLKHQTGIAEAVQENGTIRYELNLDLSLFCSYGTAITDLQSQ